MTLKETKKTLLKKMDDYARDNFDEEIFYNLWLAEGVPDECDEDTFDFIAEYDENWIGVVECFINCCKANNNCFE